MAKISTPVSGFTGTVAGVTFADGVGETADESTIAYFERHGYTVTAEAAPEPLPDGNPADSWKVDQLKRWASEHDLDLQGASKKEDILAAITASLNPPA